MGETLILGVDGGGTGCRARLYDDAGAVLGEGEGGPANLQLPDATIPFNSVMQAARAALAAAGLPEARLADCRAGLGLAGASAAARERFMAQKPPFAVTVILSDAHAATLGAHGGEDGGIVILGTGAVAYVLKEGVPREIGGWGFASDDLGSGADIGRRAVRAAARALDEVARPQDVTAPLALRVLAHVGGPGGLLDWSMRAIPGQYGALAPAVFETATEDPAAEAILARATEEMQRLTLLALKHGAQRVSVMGSVARRLAPRLTGAAAAAIVPAQDDALAGAAIAARRGEA
jgi:glucosamine kinase